MIGTNAWHQKRIHMKMQHKMSPIYMGHPVQRYNVHTCKLRFSAYRISNSRSIWTNNSYNRTLMAGGRDDICVPPITPPPPEVKEPEAGHSPPDDPPPPSTSKGPECPKPGYAKRFWTKEVVPETKKRQSSSNMSKRIWTYKSPN